MAITGKYEYRGAGGELLYYKERIEPGRNGIKKEFRFYHGNKELGRGGDPVLYHCADVIRSKAVIITEGEKQADILKQWGLAGTSLDSGAGSKLTESMIEVLAGKRVAILRDNDEPGLAYATKLADALHGKCESVRVVLLSQLPDKGDLCDWHGDKKQMLSEIKATPEWVPTPKKEPAKIYPAKMSMGEITAEMIEAAKQYPIDKLIEFQGGKATCFNHKEKTASLVFNPTRNKCHCFGCGGSWDGIDVLMVRDSMNFASAVRSLQ